jgi:hypothetical protein
VGALPPLPDLPAFREDGPCNPRMLAVARAWRAMRDLGPTPERLATWHAALTTLRTGKPPK